MAVLIDHEILVDGSAPWSKEALLSGLLTHPYMQMVRYADDGPPPSAPRIRSPWAGELVPGWAVLSPRHEESGEIREFTISDGGRVTRHAGLDHPLTTWADIESAPVTAHVRTLMRTCWRLGGLPEYELLRLRAWTHTLGYRGHILTKSRAYSTTYAALRAERADHMGHGDGPDAVTERQWRYVGSGHTPGAALIAAGVAEDLAASHALGREAMSDRRWCECPERR
jgi:hypothetical protein